MHKREELWGRKRYICVLSDIIVYAAGFFPNAELEMTWQPNDTKLGMTWHVF